MKHLCKRGGGRESGREFSFAAREGRSWERETEEPSGESEKERAALCLELPRAFYGPLIFAASLLPRSIDTSYFYG